MSLISCEKHALTSGGREVDSSVSVQEGPAVKGVSSSPQQLATAFTSLVVLLNSRRESQGIMLSQTRNDGWALRITVLLHSRKEQKNRKQARACIYFLFLLVANDPSREDIVVESGPVGLARLLPAGHRAGLATGASLPWCDQGPTRSSTVSVKCRVGGGREEGDPRVGPGKNWSDDGGGWVWREVGMCVYGWQDG